MDLFYFLSYGVLIVSKTKQGAKKAGRILRPERGTQFPAVHFSCERFSKRRRLCPGQDFIGKGGGDTAGQEFLPQNSGASVPSFGCMVLCKPAIVEKVLVNELIEDLLRGFTEPGGEPFAEFRDRIIAAAEQLEGIKVNFIHNLKPGTIVPTA